MALEAVECSEVMNDALQYLAFLMLFFLFSLEVNFRSPI